MLQPKKSPLLSIAIGSVLIATFLLLGVFYWDATWTAVEGNDWDPTDPNSGNGWDNQAQFDFDGKALPAQLEFQGQ